MLCNITHLTAVCWHILLKSIHVPAFIDIVTKVLILLWLWCSEGWIFGLFTKVFTKAFCLSFSRKMIPGSYVKRSHVFVKFLQLWSMTLPLTELFPWVILSDNHQWAVAGSYKAFLAFFVSFCFFIHICLSLLYATFCYYYSFSSIAFRIFLFYSN